MDNQRVRTRLEHMMAAIAAIERLAGGLTASDYASDPDRRAAVERYFEKLSEASRHLPSDLKAGHTSVPWRQLADLGNVLRHAYDQVSDARVVMIVSHELQILKETVSFMLSEIDNTRD